MKAMLQLMKLQSAWVVEDPEEIVYEQGPKVNQSFRYFKTDLKINSKTSTVKKIKRTKEGRTFKTSGCTYKLVKVK